MYYDYSNGMLYPKREKLWGGTLLENTTQAFSRDVLVDIMRRVDARNDCNWYCIGTVHDEIWYLVRNGEENDLNVLLTEMARPIPWANGLITKGDGFVDERYVK
mgnify:FL=1